MNWWCELDGAPVAPPGNADAWAFTLSRDLVAHGGFHVQSDLLAFTGEALRRVVAAWRDGRPSLPLRLGWREGQTHHLLAELPLDLTRLTLSPTAASAPLGLTPPQATLRHAQPLACDLLSGLTRAGQALASSGGTAPLTAWLDSPLPPGADATSVSALRLGDALTRAVEAATDNALTAHSSALALSGLYAGLAIASARMIRQWPAAPLALSVDELLTQAQRLLALGWGLEGTTLRVEPIEYFYPLAEPHTLRVAPEQLIELPADALQWGQIHYGYDALALDAPTPLPHLHEPAHAVISPGSSPAVLDLRCRWQAEAALVERLRATPYAGPTTAPTAADHTLCVFDLERAPHPAAGGAVVWRLQRGVADAAGLDHPQWQPGWALTPAAQLRRWSPLWGHATAGGPITATPSMPTTRARGQGPAHRLGQSWLGNGRLRLEPTGPFATDEPTRVTHPLFSGRSLTAQLTLSPSQLTALLSEPLRPIRLELGGPRYRLGYLLSLAATPATGRATLTLLLSA